MLSNRLIVLRPVHHPQVEKLKTLHYTIFVDVYCFTAYLMVPAGHRAYNHKTEALFLGTLRLRETDMSINTVQKVK